MALREYVEEHMFLDAEEKLQPGEIIVLLRKDGTSLVSRIAGGRLRRIERPAYEPRYVPQASELKE